MVSSISQQPIQLEHDSNVTNFITNISLARLFGFGTGIRLMVGAMIKHMQ